MKIVQTSSYGGRYLKLTISEKSVSIEDNTSTIEWVLESIGGSSGYYNIYGCQVIVNGETLYGPISTNWDSYVFPSAKGAVSGTKVIKHNDDGTASPVSFTLIGSVFYNNPQAYSDSLTLATIPRASSINVIDANIGASTNITINKATSIYTTTLYYKADGETEWTKIVDKITENVYGWQVPTSFYKLIPNSPTIVCEFKAETYNDDKLIGEKTTTATFTATGSPIIKDVEAIDVNSGTIYLTGDNTKIVKNASIIQIGFQTEAQNEATIVSAKVNGLDASGGGTMIIKPTTTIFTIVVKDSRGYETTYEYSYSQDKIVDYKTISMNGNVVRNQPTDNKARMNYNGSFFNGNFGVQNNEINLRYRYKKQDEENFGEWVETTPTIENDEFYENGLLIDNIDYRSNYIFEIDVYDKLSGQTITGIKVMKGIPIINWNDKKFNVNGDIEFKGDLYQNGEKIEETEIIDNLTSDSATSALSANQGRILKELIDLAGGEETIGKNYITYKSGLKMCWGRVITYNLNGYFRQGDITFPITFASAPIVMPALHMVDANIAETRTSCGVFGYPSTTGVAIRLGNPNAELSTRTLEVSYFAIGF